ncbi:MAG: hypothetical protein U1E62_21795 [Alsobacter sp.]
MANNPAVKRSGSIITVGQDVRIEAGPARLESKASPELLSNERTAEHYQVGLIDAAGRTIEIGKPMTYLDWKGRPGFYVAQWVPDEAHPDQGVWQDRGFYPTEEDAVAFAKTIAAK